LYSGCPWDKFKFACSNPALNVIYDVEYYSGVVACGNLFRESDIGGGKNVAPIVQWPQAKADAIYAFVMTDPDADLDGSFPLATKPGSHAPVRHWVVGNIPGTVLLNDGDLTSGTTTVAPFIGPSPPAGSHRYGQFLFEQKGTIEYEIFANTSSHVNWDYFNWTKTYDLGDPIASNWHITDHSA